MISAEQARSTILERVPVLGPVSLSVRRAGGHRLHGDLAAPVNVPPFDNSAMDGYAVRSGDLRDTPVLLAIAGETAAGSGPGEPLARGTARAVMTGAPIPPGADAVVQIEWTERASDREVRVLRNVAAGANVRRAGSDIPADRIALAGGTLVGPFEQGMLASLGVEFVTVHRLPSVRFIPTGNELTPPGTPLGPGKIRESNSHVVAGLLRREGCDARIDPIVADDRGSLAAAFAARRGDDALLISGGVSAGRFDIVPDALAAAGVEIVFHRVNIKPGMPLLFGMRGDTPVFALPGNPVSAAVTFLQFVRPAVRKLSGDPDPGRRETVRARLADSIVKKDGKRHFLRGRLERSDGELRVRLAGPQGSNVASGLAAADCLVILPEERSEFGRLDIIEAEML